MVIRAFAKRREVVIYIFLLNFGYIAWPHILSNAILPWRTVSGDNSSRSCAAPEKLLTSAAEYAGSLSIYTVFLCLWCGGMLYCVVYDQRMGYHERRRAALIPIFVSNSWDGVSYHSDWQDVLSQNVLKSLCAGHDEHIKLLLLVLLSLLFCCLVVYFLCKLAAIIDLPHGQELSRHPRHKYERSNSTGIKRNPFGASNLYHSLQRKWLEAGSPFHRQSSLSISVSLPHFPTQVFFVRLSQYKPVKACYKQS